MRICVCGAQAPFMRGGAELLMDNLAAALQSRGHQAELVRLPVAWDRDHVLASALSWRLLSMPADAVIATNFPSYFVQHPRKVIWLVHQHRSAYDLAGARWSDIGEGRDDNAVVSQLAQWDTVAIGEASGVFTISERVSERLRTFNGLESKCLYHPPPLFERLTDSGDEGYLLCASRLEANKRVELAIEGLAAAGGDGRLVVAGAGSRAEDLKRLAAERGVENRVEFLGFVSDDELAARFSKCRAVIYPPHDEDYGYATLQAFAASKPVIAPSDSGGILEWVRDGDTGWVTEPEAQATGRAISEALSNPSECRRRGQAGHACVEALSWDDVVDSLLSVV